MICSTASRCPCLGITECDDNRDTSLLTSIHPTSIMQFVTLIRTGNKMPHLVPILGTHPVQGNSHLKWIICPLWQFITHTKVFHNILLADSHCCFDILRWSHGPSPDAIINCMPLSFVSKYTLGLLTEPGFNSTYLFRLFNTLSGYDGCTNVIHITYNVKVVL